MPTRMQRMDDFQFSNVPSPTHHATTPCVDTDTSNQIFDKMRLSGVRRASRRAVHRNPVDTGLSDLPQLIRMADGTMMERKAATVSSRVVRSGLAARVLKEASFSKKARRESNRTLDADSRLLSNLFEIDFDTRHSLEDVAAGVAETQRHYKAFIKDSVGRRRSKSFAVSRFGSSPSHILVDAVANPPYPDDANRASMQSTPFSLTSQPSPQKRSPSMGQPTRPRYRHPLDDLIRSEPTYVRPIFSNIEDEVDKYGRTLRSLSGQVHSTTHAVGGEGGAAAALTRIGRAAQHLKESAPPSTTPTRNRVEPGRGERKGDVGVEKNGSADDVVFLAGLWRAQEAKDATVGDKRGRSSDAVRVTLSPYEASSSIHRPFDGVHTWGSIPYRRHVAKKVDLLSSISAQVVAMANRGGGHLVLATQQGFHRASNMMAGPLHPSHSSFVVAVDGDEEVDKDILTADELSEGDAASSAEDAGSYPRDHTDEAVDRLVGAVLGSVGDDAVRSVPPPDTLPGTPTSDAALRPVVIPPPLPSTPTSVATRRALVPGLESVLPPSSHNSLGVNAFVAHVSGYSSRVALNSKSAGADGAVHVSSTSRRAPAVVPAALPDPAVAVSLAAAQCVERSGLSLSDPPCVLPGGGMVVGVRDGVVPGLLTAPLGGGVAVARTSLRVKDLPTGLLESGGADFTHGTDADNVAVKAGSGCGPLSLRAVFVSKLVPSLARWVSSATSTIHDDMLPTDDTDAVSSAAVRKAAAHDYVASEGFDVPLEPHVVSGGAVDGGEGGVLGDGEVHPLSPHTLAGVGHAARLVRDALCRGKSGDITALLRSHKHRRWLCDERGNPSTTALWACSLAVAGVPAAKGASSSWHGAVPADVAAASAYLATVIESVRESAPAVFEGGFDPLDTVGCLDTSPPVFPDSSSLTRAPEAFAAMYRAAVHPDFAGFFVEQPHNGGVSGGRAVDPEAPVWLVVRTSARGLGQRVVREGVRSALQLLGRDAVSQLPSPHLAVLPTQQGFLPDSDEVASASDEAARQLLRQRPPPSLTAFLDAESFAREVAATSRSVALHRLSLSLEVLSQQAVSWETSCDIPTTSVTFECEAPREGEGHSDGVWVHRSNAAALSLARPVQPLNVHMDLSRDLATASVATRVFGTRYQLRHGPSHGRDADERIIPLPREDCGEGGVGVTSASIATPVACSASVGDGWRKLGPVRQRDSPKRPRKRTASASLSSTAPVAGVVTLSELSAAYDNRDTSSQPESSSRSGGLDLIAVARALHGTLPHTCPSLDIAGDVTVRRLTPVAVLGGAVSPPV